MTLIQTKKISDKIPVVLIGKEFWDPIHKWLHEEIFIKQQAVDKADLSMYTIVDTAEEAFEIVKNAPPREEFYY
ncbi:MAG: hypothetical protein A3C69_00780 [Candidatus Yanofskybacteria bacterium RIFCSPHIGHO2_02_FULL_43_12]|nr:MAG: hypothetical protein A3C69_00780 [Candidatus Yanofskybacteria bacterium RIFCSPHIGHO2_02_FULL_43_12]